MKKLFSILASFLIASFLFTPLGVASAAFPIPSTPSTNPDDYVSEDTQDSLTNSAGAVDEDVQKAIEDPSSLAQMDTRKNLILDSTRVAKNALKATDEAIDNCANCTDAQQDQLHECTDMSEENIAQYEKEVNAADTNEELTAASQAYAARVQANQTKIKECVMTASAVGIGVMLEVSYKFTQDAERYWNWLKPLCLILTDENKKDGDALFTTAYEQYNQLKAIYDKIYADGTVSTSEQAQLEEALGLSIEYATTLASIYLFLYSSSSLCGVPVPA